MANPVAQLNDMHVQRHPLVPQPPAETKTALKQHVLLHSADVQRVPLDDQLVADMQHEVFRFLAEQAYWFYSFPDWLKQVRAAAASSSSSGAATAQPRSVMAQQQQQQKHASYAAIVAPSPANAPTATRLM